MILDPKGTGKLPPKETSKINPTNDPFTNGLIADVHCSSHHSKMNKSEDDVRLSPFFFAFKSYLYSVAIREFTRESRSTQEADQSRESSQGMSFSQYSIDFTP
jgi:hypothetical protein